MTQLAHDLQHYREQITRVRRILDHLDPDVDGQAAVDQYRAELALWEQLAGELEQHLDRPAADGDLFDLEEAPPLF